MGFKTTTGLSMETAVHNSANHTSNSLVTIAMTAYRRPTMILQALLSCTAQDYRPLEIDVSDDSPNDDTEKAVRSIAVPDGISLRYRRNRPSLGEPENVNSLFGNARGRYTVLLHDDDALLPGAVSTLMEAITCHPGAVAAFGIQEVIWNSGESSPEESQQLNAYYLRDARFAGLLEDPLLSALRRQFPNNGYLVETEAARRVGYRGHAQIGRAGDTDFGIRLGQLYRNQAFVFVAQPVSQYRMTDGSSRSMTGISSKIYEFLEAMEDLSPAQSEARYELMRRLTQHAVVDNALNRNRRRALQMFLSKPYRARVSLQMALYHLTLIAWPRLYRLKPYTNLKI
jgi:glycosyltransferase involved in cell wall biosynthesis